MKSYLKDANASDIITYPHNVTRRRRAHTPPCLRFSFSSMTRTQKRNKGREMEEKERHTHTLLFFVLFFF